MPIIHTITLIILLLALAGVLYIIHTITGED
jgi:hypothetical protein